MIGFTNPELEFSFSSTQQNEKQRQNILITCIKYTGSIKYHLKLPVCFGDSLKLLLTQTHRSVM